MFDSIKTIKEFDADGVVYGVYDVEFKGRNQIFIRNGNSIGVITFCLGERADKCVSIVRDDVAKEFIEEWAKGESQ